MSQEQQEKLQPAQAQETPGNESEMTPKPEYDRPDYQGSNKLKGKVALITGGDSGIGRAIAVLYAKEGADSAIVFKEESEDAEKTKRLVEAEGQKCLLIEGDVGSEAFCQSAVEQTVSQLGGLDILVNNAAEQHPVDSIEEITEENLERTFRTNIFGYFFLAKAAVKHLGKGSSIINTTSVTAYLGAENLLDYSSTKGAIVAFTRSLSKNLVKKGIRVNAVAPGPIWTPLIPATMPDAVESFGVDTPIGRPGQPVEVATCYVFLASEDASYMTGQTLHPNGGEVING